jgi:hypothetical protein
MIGPLPKIASNKKHWGLAWWQGGMRRCSRMDKPRAIMAAAHKLAWLVFSMLAKDRESTDQGQDCHESVTASASCSRSLKLPPSSACR